MKFENLVQRILLAAMISIVGCAELVSSRSFDVKNLTEKDSRRAALEGLELSGYEAVDKDNLISGLKKTPSIMWQARISVRRTGSKDTYNTNCSYSNAQGDLYGNYGPAKRDERTEEALLGNIEFCRDRISGTQERIK